MWILNNLSVSLPSRFLWLLNILYMFLLTRMVFYIGRLNVQGQVKSAVDLMEIHNFFRHTQGIIEHKVENSGDYHKEDVSNKHRYS